MFVLQYLGFVILNAEKIPKLERNTERSLGGERIAERQKGGYTRYVISKIWKHGTDYCAVDC